MRDWIKQLDEIDRDCVHQYEYLLGRNLTGPDEYSEIDSQVDEMILEWESRKEFFDAYPELAKYKQDQAKKVQVMPHEKSASPYNPHKWFLEVVQDFDGTYYANMMMGGKPVLGLPEHVDYNTLKEAIRQKTGVDILKKKEMKFQQSGRKKYAYIDATQERADCRVTLAEIDNGWRPKFDPEPSSIPDGPIYIPPQANHSCNLDDPCILVGTITQRNPELVGEKHASAASLSVHITGLLHQNGSFESAPATANFYDTDHLYETSLEAAKARVTDLYEQIRFIKGLPRIGEPDGHYGSHYFKVIDLAALTDLQLITAKNLAVQFAGRYTPALARIESEIVRRFEEEKSQSLADRLNSANSRAVTSQPENSTTQSKAIDIAQVAQEIVEVLKYCGFNSCTDASGYYVINDFGDDLERCVEVYKSNGDGAEPDHYVVYCSYEDEGFDFRYTTDLSVEALEKVLRELAKDDCFVNLSAEQTPPFADRLNSAVSRASKSQPEDPARQIPPTPTRD